jgi:hypothetical protein
MASSDNTSIESVQSRIYTIRGLRVMLDADLAELYDVPTKRFNEQVKRNIARFPEDFLFQLTPDEFVSLRSQNATSKPGHGGRRYLPYAFTEHGAIMAATILNTPRAVEMSVFVVRAFVRLRELLLTNKQFALKLGELEQKVMSHDRDISMIINTIRQLMTRPVQKKRQIGFLSTSDDEK